jgi:hypothetical protein
MQYVLAVWNEPPVDRSGRGNAVNPVVGASQMRYVSPVWPNSNCCGQESIPFPLLPMLTVNVHRMGELEQSVFVPVATQTTNCNVDGNGISGCPLQVF